MNGDWDNYYIPEVSAVMGVIDDLQSSDCQSQAAFIKARQAYATEMQKVNFIRSNIPTVQSLLTMT